VNFKKGVHGAIVFARSDALFASINATPPPPSAKPYVRYVLSGLLLDHTPRRDAVDGMDENSPSSPSVNVG
jgi:hypothetical protein